MAVIVTTLILLACFMGLGLGIVFFGRKDISAECGTVPNHTTNECPSKAAGICPTQAKNEALDMALSFSKFHKLKNRSSAHPDDY